jgi:hypothetical protein
MQYVEEYQYLHMLHDTSIKMFEPDVQLPCTDVHVCVF